MLASRGIYFALFALMALTQVGCRAKTQCSSFEDSSDRGSRCQVVWQDCEDGMTRQIVCQDDGRCECRVDGHMRRQFGFDRFCQLGSADRNTSRANRECGWRLSVSDGGEFSLPFSLP